MRRLVFLPLFVLLAGCWTTPTRPPVVGPGPARGQTLHVQVVDVAGPPIAGATVTILDNQNAGKTGTTNARGQVFLDDLTTPSEFTVRAEAEGYAPSTAPVRLVSPTGGPWSGNVTVRLATLAPPAPAVPSTRYTGPLRVSGRSWVTDAGTFRPLFVMSGGTLAQLIRGDEAAAVAYMDWAKATGFNGLRFFGGNLTWQNQTAADALRVLPRALQLAKDRGLYVSVSALTDTRNGIAFDKGTHVAAVARAIQAAGNGLLEVANETYHPSQDDATHDVGNLRRWGAVSPVPWAVGAAEIDELTTPCSEGGVYPNAGGSWISIHLRRSREWFVQLARVRELEAVSSCHGVPVMSNEPIGWAESDVPGKRLANPEAFYMLAAFSEVMELGSIGMGEHALRSQLPGPVQQACAEAFVQGVRDLRAVLGQGRITLKNGHWADAPATGRFVNEKAGESIATPNRVWRVTSGVAGDRAVSILAGINGDPGLRYQNGWREVRLVREWAKTRVYELAK